MRLRFAIVFLVAAVVIDIAQAQVVETSDKEDTTGMPRVVFFARQRSFPKAVVYCDLTKVAQVQDHTHFEIALSPGLHLCSAEIVYTVGGFARAMGADNLEKLYKVEDLPLEVKPGPKQWVSVHWRHVGWTHITLRLTPEDPAQAAKEVEKHTRPVKPEEQFIRSINRKPAGPAGN